MSRTRHHTATVGFPAKIRFPAKMNARESGILRLVVQSFIETAGPIASRFLALRYNLGLSSASIRNTLNALENKGYLKHPHTSSGRVPTDQGYRAYVDSLMEKATLQPDERRLMREHLVAVQEDTDALVEESSRVLARLAGLLGVALGPQLRSGILERLEIVPVSSDRVMFVISVQGGVIRTIVLNIVVELKRHHLDRLIELLNERLSGLSLEEIRRTCCDRVMDLKDERTGLVQLILNDADTLFSDDADRHKIRVEGTANMLAQPEFNHADEMRSIVSLIDDSSGIVELFRGRNPEITHAPATARVLIGREMDPDGSISGNIRNLSIVTSQYQRSNMQGTIGVIGPTRMDYARVIALVEGMALLMSWPGEKNRPGIGTSVRA
ncbi:MAG: heat-inducible transcription repressor HrcA [Bacteroidetes bacterium]|nr:MAG: heat-inducible transcription repressor HrcA [Bacteroidota bacterium]